MPLGFALRSCDRYPSGLAGLERPFFIAVLVESSLFDSLAAAECVNFGVDVDHVRPHSQPTVRPCPGLWKRLCLFDRCPELGTLEPCFCDS